MQSKHGIKEFERLENFEMSILSEQIKEIKACAYAHEASGDAIYGTASILYQATDTIEALSAKLSVENQKM